MGLGAAGCGNEYDRIDYRCKFLKCDLFGFKCLKYNKELKKHERLKDPVRYEQCCKDASKEAWNKIMKRKQSKT